MLSTVMARCPLDLERDSMVQGEEFTIQVAERQVIIMDVKLRTENAASSQDA